MAAGLAAVAARVVVDVAGAGAAAGREPAALASPRRGCDSISRRPTNGNERHPLAHTVAWPVAMWSEHRLQSPDRWVESEWPDSFGSSRGW